jgi:hypothetical protein
MIMNKLFQKIEIIGITDKKTLNTIEMMGMTEMVETIEDLLIIIEELREEEHFLRRVLHPLRELTRLYLIERE